MTKTLYWREFWTGLYKGGAGLIFKSHEMNGQDKDNAGFLPKPTLVPFLIVKTIN